MSTAVAQATLNIPTETIEEARVIGVQSQFIFEDLALKRNIKTNSYIYTILTPPVEAGSHTENNTISATALAWTNGSITTAPAAFRAQLSKKAETTMVRDGLMDCLIACMRSIGLKLDDDLLTLAGSMTGNLGGGVNEEFTVSFLMEKLAAFGGRCRYAPKMAAVLHSDAYRDLVADMAANGGGLLSSAWGPALATALTADNVATLGKKGSVHNCDIYVSDRIPASGLGWANMFTVVDQVEAGVGMAFTTEPQYWQEFDPIQACTNLVGYVDFGVGILDQNRCAYAVSRT